MHKPSSQGKYYRDSGAYGCQEIYWDYWLSKLGCKKFWRRQKLLTQKKGGGTRVGEEIPSDERVNIFSDPDHPTVPGALGTMRVFRLRNAVSWIEMEWLKIVFYTRFGQEKQRLCFPTGRPKWSNHGRWRSIALPTWSKALSVVFWWHDSGISEA